MNGLWTRYASWYDRNFLPWYNRWAPAMVIGCLTTVALVSIATYTTYARQETDRASREVENRTLLDCFDQYATANSATSTKVREAAVEVDQARVKHDRALKAEGKAFKVLVEHLLTKDVTHANVRRLAITLQNREQASDELVARQRNLDRVRRENPVPKPPSKFCELP